MNGNRYCEAAIVCGGNINDPGICLYLAKVKRDLQKILHADRDELQIQKVERWNSVRVTFRLPQNAVQRLRLLAEKNPEALRSLGILSVQVDGVIPRNVSAASTSHVTPSLAVGVSASTPSVSTLNVTNANSIVVNNNFNNSSTSSVFNNSINSTSTANVNVASSSLPSNNVNSSYVDQQQNPNAVRRNVVGIRQTVPQQQHQYHQGPPPMAPTTSNCYAPPLQAQTSPAAIYANYHQATNATATFNQPHQHQQRTRMIYNPAAHCGTNANTSSSSNAAGPPNSSPLLVNLLQQHSPPPSGPSSTIVQQVVEQTPPTKKRKKTAKQKQNTAAQAAAAAAASTSYCAVGGCHSDVQVTNFSSQSNLVLAPPPHAHLPPQQQQQHHHQHHPPPFHPSVMNAVAPSMPSSANQMKQQPSGYSNYAESNAVVLDTQQQQPAHHPAPPHGTASRADRDATISLAIDSVVSRVSMPPVVVAPTPEVQQQNIQHHWINEDNKPSLMPNVIGHSGHVEGAVSDLSNVHQSPAMFDAAMSSTAAPPHHPSLHAANRITTPTNHISEAQHHQQQSAQHQQQQQSSSFYGNVVEPYLHHMAPPPQPQPLPPSPMTTSAAAQSPWSHSAPMQHPQQQHHPFQQNFNVRPPCSLPIQQTSASSTPTSSQQQQQQQMQQQDLHHSSSNVWLSPPPSYGSVTNFAVHSQTKVNPPQGSLVNGDDQSGLNLWRHDVDVAAVLNCHDSELRWTDHDYLSDGYHHQQQQNLMNSSSSSTNDYVLHTATATASAVVTSGATPNPLFKTTNQQPPNQWNQGGGGHPFGVVANTEVQDTFHDNGGGDLHSTVVRQSPWHSMPYDGAKTSVGLRTSAPNANSPQMQPVLPENMLHGNYSPG